MRRLLILFIGFFLCTTALFSQDKKAYFIRITVDKLQLGKDSVVLKQPKTIYIETSGKTDTTEVGKVKGTPVGIVVEVQKYFAAKQMRYRIGYTFFKKENGKWVLIKNFGFVDRFSLLPKPEEIKKSKSPKAAHEEYACSIGEPMQFAAKFRMDVYLNQ